MIRHTGRAILTGDGRTSLVQLDIERVQGRRYEGWARAFRSPGIGMGEQLTVTLDDGTEGTMTVTSITGPWEDRDGPVVFDIPGNRQDPWEDR